VLLLPAPCCRPKVNHDLFFFMPAYTAAAAAITAAPCSQQGCHQRPNNAAAVSHTSDAPRKDAPRSKGHNDSAHPYAAPTPTHPPHQHEPLSLHSRLRPVSPGSCSSRSSAARISPMRSPLASASPSLRMSSRPFSVYWSSTSSLQFGQAAE
jgi:hypothetical protein